MDFDEDDEFMDFDDEEEIEHSKELMDAYNDYKYPEPDKIWDFVKRHNWPEYVEGFTQVENKMMELY